jgi:hypothetical protein
MVVGMASFTMNDAITKAVSSEMNFGQVMLVRGLFATVLIAAFAAWRGALRPLRTLFIKPVGMRVIGEIGGTMAFLTAIVNLPLANTAAIFQGCRWPSPSVPRLRSQNPSAGAGGLRSRPVLSVFSSSSGPDWKASISTRCSRWARWSSSPCATSRHARFRPKSRRCSLQS